MPNSPDFNALPIFHNPVHNSVIPANNFSHSVIVAFRNHTPSPRHGPKDLNTLKNLLTNPQTGLWVIPNDVFDNLFQIRASKMRPDYLIRHVLSSSRIRS